jgi:hypothetical protein
LKSVVEGPQVPAALSGSILPLAALCDELAFWRKLIGSIVLSLPGLGLASNSTAP